MAGVPAFRRTQCDAVALRARPFHGYTDTARRDAAGEATGQLQRDRAAAVASTRELALRAAWDSAAEPTSAAATAAFNSRVRTAAAEEALFRRRYALSRLLAAEHDVWAAHLEHEGAASNARRPHQTVLARDLRAAAEEYRGFQRAAQTAKPQAYRFLS